MTEADITKRALTAMSVILALYAVVQGALFAISGEPVYLCIAAAGAVASAVTAYVRRKRSPRVKTGEWVSGPSVLAPGESFTFRGTD